MYKTLTTTDFSAYQQVSFWINPSQTIAANSITIKLCSDTVAATPVNTMTITTKLTANTFNCITLNNGSALGSSIQSIGVFFSSGITTSCNISFDNIIACKSTGSVDSLSLNSLIGQNDGLWYAIQSISGTTVVLDIDAATSSTGGTPRGYHGSTGSAEIWKREAYATTDTTAVPVIINAGGSSGSVVTISGGWDSSAMSSQTGDTWFDGVANGKEVISSNGVTINFVTVDHCSTVRGTDGFKTIGTNWTISNASAVAAGTTGQNFTVNGAGPHTLTSINSIQGTNTGISFGTNTVKITMTGTSNILSGQSAGFSSPASGVIYGNGATLTSSNNGTNGLTLAGRFIFGTLTTNKNGSSGLNITSVNGRVEIASVTSNNNTSNGVNMGGANDVKIYSLSTASNSTGVTFTSQTVTGKLITHNWVSTSDTTQASVSGISTYTDFRFNSHEEGGTAGNNVIRTDGGTIKSQTTTRHTASGVAWQLSPTDTKRDSNYPLSLSVAKVAVNASSLVTITAYLQYSSSTNLVAQLRIPANSLGGVGSSDLTAQVSAASNTWQQLTLTFTPTEQGVVEVFCDTWIINGGTTDSAYIDDMTFSQ